MATTLKIPNNNPYKPMQGLIEDIITETSDVKTFVIRLSKEIIFEPGQFIMVYVPGVGEAPFAIASPPGETNVVEITVRRVGDVTNALHRLTVGRVVGVRGPFGRGFPLKELIGKDIVVLAGGTGLLGVSSLLWYIYLNKELFGKTILLYGVRTPRDFLRKRDLSTWSKRIEVYLSVDKTNGCRWGGFVCLVTDLLDIIGVDPRRTYVLCGPPLMIKAAYYKLVMDNGVSPSKIYVSLERHMKCGLGKCGRCMLSNGLYVCLDGPVFRCDQIPMREMM